MSLRLTGSVTAPARGWLLISLGAAGRLIAAMVVVQEEGGFGILCATPPSPPAYEVHRARHSWVKGGDVMRVSWRAG